MVSTVALRSLSRLVNTYVVVVVLTLAALVVLSIADPSQAPQDAWVHEVVVAAFAVLLPLRLRAARRGDGGALRAVGVIAGVLLAVNLVEAIVLDVVPVWMRVEMAAVAVLMAAVVVLVVRERR